MSVLLLVANPSECEMVSRFGFDLCSLMMSDLRVFVCLLYVSFEKFLSKPFAYFLFELSFSCPVGRVLCLFVCLILYTRPLSFIWFTNIVFHSVVCYFLHMLTCSTQVLILKSKLSSFSFVACSFVSKKQLINPKTDLFLCFLLRFL